MRTFKIEFANVIILNKTDLVSEDRLGLLKATIHKLNPSAKIITSTINFLANAIVGNDAKVLQDIHLKSKNIAIYERNIALLKAELSRMMEQPMECRATGTTSEVLSSVKCLNF